MTVWTLSGQCWMRSSNPSAAMRSAAALAGLTGFCTMRAFAMPMMAARTISAQPAGLRTETGYECRSSPTPGAR